MTMTKHLARLICLSVLLSPSIATATHDNDIAGEYLASNAKRGKFQFSEDIEKLASWAHESGACRSYSRDPEHLSDEEKDLFKKSIRELIRNPLNAESFYSSLEQATLSEEQKNLLMILTYAFLEIA